MNRTFTTALGMLFAAAGIPVLGAELNGDLSGGRSSGSQAERSSSTAVESRSSEQTSTYDRSQGSSRTDQGSSQSATRSSGHNQGDRTAARDAESDRQTKLAASDMANPDASFRMHLSQARASFKADDPSEASRHIDQAMAVINRELGADSQKTDARLSTNERTATDQTGDQSRTAGMHADMPAERQLRRSVQSLKEFNTKLSQKQLKSQDDFKQAYANVYRDLALYHYAKAQEDPNAMSASAAHRDSSARGGAANVPSSDGSKPLTASQADDVTRVHGNNATSAMTGRDARHTPNYHAQQAAEYLQVWAQLQDKDLDQKTMTTIQSFQTINVTSSDRVEQARLAELGRILDESGFKTETIATERSSSTSTSIERSSDEAGGISRSQSQQSTTERSSSQRSSESSTDRSGGTGSNTPR